MASSVEEARQAFLDALEEAGMDRTTAEAQTRYILPSEPTVVGNYADLQRMGAAVVTGTIPTPPSMDDVETSDLSEAFAVPADANLREQIGNDGGAASLPTPDTVTTQAGQGTDTSGDGDLSSMTKAQLLDEAASRGVDVSESWTKAEIIEAMS